MEAVELAGLELEIWEPLHLVVVLQVLRHVMLLPTAEAAAQIALGMPRLADLVDRASLSLDIPITIPQQSERSLAPLLRATHPMKMLQDCIHLPLPT
jgi:hypothetical protein